MTTRPTAQLAAFAIAAVMTFAMLGGVDHLATSQPAAGQLAQAAQVAPRT
jgi:hypothetical protein